MDEERASLTPIPGENVMQHLERRAEQQGQAWTHADAALWERALHKARVPSQGLAQDWIACLSRVETLLGQD